MHSGAFLALFERGGVAGGSSLLELKFSCLISQRTFDDVYDCLVAPGGAPVVVSAEQGHCSCCKQCFGFLFVQLLTAAVRSPER